MGEAAEQFKGVIDFEAYFFKTAQFNFIAFSVNG